MTELTQDGRKALAEIASRHGVSPDAVEHILMTLLAGHGTQAQFNHPDLGGMGQWSMGGMTMVGDMFNNVLKARVDAICSEVAQLMQHSEPLHAPASFSSQSQSQSGTTPGSHQNQTSGDQTSGGQNWQSQSDGVSLFVSGGSSGNWWPDDLGQPSSTGAQNQMRYASFPSSSRLAIDVGDGQVRVYDTEDHQIGGFSQQQSGDQSLSFTSQHGLVKISQLREVGATPKAQPEPKPDTGSRTAAPMLSDVFLKAESSNRKADDETRDAESIKPDQQDAQRSAIAESVQEEDIFAKIERLADLHSKGILTDSEYQAKKAELLARL